MSKLSLFRQSKMVISSQIRPVDSELTKDEQKCEDILQAFADSFRAHFYITKSLLYRNPNQGPLFDRTIPLHFELLHLSYEYCSNKYRQIVVDDAIEGRLPLIQPFYYSK